MSFEMYCISLVMGGREEKELIFVNICYVPSTEIWNLHIIILTTGLGFSHSIKQKMILKMLKET
jgi:hypothetical protein